MVSETGLNLSSQNVKNFVKKVGPSIIAGRVLRNFIPPLGVIIPVAHAGYTLAHRDKSNQTTPSDTPVSNAQSNGVEPSTLPAPQVQAQTPASNPPYSWEQLENDRTGWINNKW